MMNDMNQQSCLLELDIVMLHHHVDVVNLKNELTFVTSNLIAIQCIPVCTNFCKLFSMGKTVE